MTPTEATASDPFAVVVELMATDSPGDGPAIERPRRQRGLRIVRTSERSVTLSLDGRRIRELGPRLEALATVEGASLRLVDLDALVPLGGLDEGPSRIWTVIETAVDRAEAAIDRGEEPMAILDFVRVEVVDGIRVARDGRPAMVAPRGRGPVDGGTVKYDDVDWHEGAAVESGEPVELAGVHIGLYLGWLVRRGMHDPAAFDQEDLERYVAGRTSGIELLGAGDGKLLSDLMRAEGTAFSDARYGRYVSGYDDLLADAPPSRAPDGPAAVAAVDELLDGMYAEWVAEGRPGPEPDGDAGATEDEMAAAGRAAERLGGRIARRFAPDSPDAHPRHDLEALLPTDIDGRRPRVLSRVGADDESPDLVRLMASLGVDRRDSGVATAIVADPLVAVSVYEAPGVDANDISDALAAMPGWPAARDIAGRPVRWRTLGRDDATGAFADHGIVVMVGGQPEAVERLIGRYPWARP